MLQQATSLPPRPSLGTILHQLGSLKRLRHRLYLQLGPLKRLRHRLYLQLGPL